MALRLAPQTRTLTLHAVLRQIMFIHTYHDHSRFSHAHHGSSDGTDDERLRRSCQERPLRKHGNHGLRPCLGSQVILALHVQISSSHEIADDRYRPVNSTFPSNNQLQIPSGRFKHVAPDGVSRYQPVASDRHPLASAATSAYRCRSYNCSWVQHQHFQCWTGQCHQNRFVRTAHVWVLSSAI